MTREPMRSLLSGRNIINRQRHYHGDEAKRAAHFAISNDACRQLHTCRVIEVGDDDGGNNGLTAMRRLSTSMRKNNLISRGVKYHLFRYKPSCRWRLASSFHALMPARAALAGRQLAYRHQRISSYSHYRRKWRRCFFDINKCDDAAIEGEMLCEIGAPRPKRRQSAAAPICT